jgi:hypothetical protein
MKTTEHKSKNYHALLFLNVQIEIRLTHQVAKLSKWKITGLLSSNLSVKTNHVTSS